MNIKGKRVVDATKPLTLKITKTDVKNGQSKLPDSCAAAVTAKRQCKGSLGVRVHLSRVYVEYPDKIVRYFTPASLRTEIISFDRGHEFEPGEYTVAAPYETNKLGVKRKGQVVQSQRPKGRSDRPDRPRLRAPQHMIAGVRARAPRMTDWK